MHYTNWTRQSLEQKMSNGV